MVLFLGSLIQVIARYLRTCDEMNSWAWEREREREREFILAGSALSHAAR